MTWALIFKKRHNFKRAFKNWDFRKVAKFTDKDIAPLLEDTGIVGFTCVGGAFVCWEVTAWHCRFGTD